ncbi:nuclear mitotic apparatus protein 1-like protein [Lates japonicus]|uniref:Nuclear mitotic apparatus protein 1-like protein n=2 Tax=Lates japonicus TaxID=270547 RepID=A0AAD3R1S3_LATJO|nr:nuclear mitotic apparatus protein 1-like protein [Lates japonicus]
MANQLKALSRENKQLRRQLEEERSMRRQLLPPSPTSQYCSSIHLPFSFSARPPLLPTSLPSSLRLPHPLSLDPATGDADRILTQTELSGAGLERPGESQALSEALWTRLVTERSVSASLEDAWSGRTSRDLPK